MLYVYKIVSGLSIYGPGRRTGIWFSGCSIHCKGCINPELWQRELKCAKTIEDVLNCVKDDDVTILGGEPLDQEDLELLIDALKQRKKSIILFTGYSISNYDERIKRIASKCDVVISEPFIDELKDDSLYLRGSLNQIITFNTKKYSESDFVKNNSFEINVDKSGIYSFGRNKQLVKELLEI